MKMDEKFSAETELHQIDPWGNVSEESGFTACDGEGGDGQADDQAPGRLPTEASGPGFLRI
jgi:hypothetical protein